LSTVVYISSIVNTAGRLLRRAEVLQAVLASDSESESDFGSDDSDNVNNDREGRALQDADADTDSGNLNDPEDSNGDVSSTVSNDSTTDDSVWECPTFVWHPAAGDVPVLYPFTGANGLNVDVGGFSPPVLPTLRFTGTNSSLCCTDK